MDNLSLYCGILISMSSRDLKREREREIRIFVVGVDVIDLFVVFRYERTDGRETFIHSE